MGRQPTGPKAKNLDDTQVLINVHHTLFVTKSIQIRLLPWLYDSQMDIFNLELLQGIHSICICECVREMTSLTFYIASF